MMMVYGPRFGLHNPAVPERVIGGHIGRDELKQRPKLANLGCAHNKYCYIYSQIDGELGIIIRGG